MSKPTARDEANRASGLLTTPHSGRFPTDLDVARAQARALTSIAVSLADLVDLARAAAAATSEADR